MASDQTLQPGESVKLTSTTPIAVTGSGTTSVTATAGAAPTPTPDPTPVPTTGGVLISKAEVMALPTSGTAYNAVLAAAKSTISPTLNDQDSPANVRTLAAALIAVRNNDSAMRSKVVTSLKGVKGTETGRALALGRELGAYVIAADLIGVTDAEVGYDFKAWLRSVIKKQTTEAGSLIDCAHNRPNNWGAHAQGALACVYAYLNDTAGLAEVAKVAKGWLGDRSSYAGFTYGDKSWQADSTKPVGVNPKGATKSGTDIDGAQPEEMRRGGTFPTIGADAKQYAPEALQGQLLCALVLSRHGYPEITSWSDSALIRAVNYIYRKMGITLTGDDSWQPHGWKKLYGPAFNKSLPSSTTPGKNMGFTDWLYA